MRQPSGDNMIITIIGMFVTGSVALTDARTTVAIGCWLLFTMFLWLTIEELWFLYKQSRDLKE